MEALIITHTILNLPFELVVDEETRETLGDIQRALLENKMLE